MSLYFVHSSPEPDVHVCYFLSHTISAQVVSVCVKLMKFYHKYGSNLDFSNLRHTLKHKFACRKVCVILA